MKNFKKYLVSMLLVTKMGVMSGCGVEEYSSTDLCRGTLYTKEKDESSHSLTIGLEFYNIGKKDISSPPSGFDYYANLRGGLGNTLEVIGCDQSAHLKWEYSHLSTISLREGWKGQTDTKLSIGSTFSEFMNAYPDSQKQNFSGGEQFKDINIWVSNYFRAQFKNEKITKMQIWGHYNDYSPSYSEYLIGPRTW